MKIFFTRLSIALFTFLVGIALTSVFIFFTQLPDIKVLSNDFDSDSADVYKFNEKKIEIKYHCTLVSKDLARGVFIVTNNSNETIYYAGYGKNSHIHNWIQQRGKITPATETSCLNGIKGQELKPDDSAIFEIPIPRNGKPFEAGFDFKKSKEGELETTWIKVNEQATFIAPHSKSK